MILKRLQIKDYRLKILFLFLFLFIIHSSLIINPVSAQEPTSSSKSATLVEKINQLKKEVASKAANFKKEVDQKLQNKAVAGTITLIEDSKITLKTSKGLKTIVVDEYTIYQLTKSSKTKSTLKDLSLDQEVVALGDLDDKNIIHAKKIIKTPRLTNNRFLAFGQVTSVNNPNFSLETKDIKKLTVQTTAKTHFYNGKQESSFEDIRTSNFLITVSDASPSANTVKARFIYLVPKGVIKPLKQNISTKSATPSSTKKN